MKLSIIIPSYNQGRYIERTLESILSQGDPDCEIILMDGGSTDDTMKVVERYRNRLSIVISEIDEGQSDALQKGYALSTGDFIGWQNSDDVYFPGAFASFRSSYESDVQIGTVADVYFGNQCIIGPNDELLNGKIFGPFRLNYLLYAGWNITNQSSFFSKKAIEEAGGFDTSLHYAMDFDLYIRLARTRAKFRWINEYWGGFRIHEASKGSTLHSVREKEYIALRSRYVKGYRSQKRWEKQFILQRINQWIIRYFDLFRLGVLTRRFIEKSNAQKIQARLNFEFLK
jgi:glycosyltransferase involved in cell wall biosynthesis